MTTRMAASNMELHALSTGREPRVATVTRMLRQTLFRCWGGLMTQGRSCCGESETVRSREAGRGRPKRRGATGRSGVSLGHRTTGRGGARIQGRYRGGAGPRGLVLVADHAHSTERYQGHVGASLIVGGVDLTGPQLYGVHPHGSYSRLPFAALGERFSPFSMNPAPRPLPHV